MPEMRYTVQASPHGTGGKTELYHNSGGLFPDTRKQARAVHGDAERRFTLSRQRERANCYHPINICVQ